MNESEANDEHSKAADESDKRYEHEDRRDQLKVRRLKEYEYVSSVETTTWPRSQPRQVCRTIRLGH